MKTKRLLMLASLLRLTAKDHFNLSMWCSRANCTACAVGTACHFKYFNDKGLAFNDNNAPTYGNHIGWAAVESFFGLEGEEATYLFNDDAYNTTDCSNPVAVAMRIEDFVKGGRDEDRT